MLLGGVHWVSIYAKTFILVKMKQLHPDQNTNGLLANVYVLINIQILAMQQHLLYNGYITFFTSRSTYYMYLSSIPQITVMYAHQNCNGDM